MAQWPSCSAQSSTVSLHERDAESFADELHCRCREEASGHRPGTSLMQVSENLFWPSSRVNALM